MISRKMLVALGIVAVVSIRVVRPSSARPEKGRSFATAQTPMPAAVLTGSASCASRACHGGSEPLPKPIQQNEYSTWLLHDKHARAYGVLLEARGKRIGANLGIVAHEDARCLACHVNPVLANADVPPSLRVLRGEGVSCEACHGPAGDNPSWLAAHTTEAWKNNPDKNDEYAKHHMTNIADLQTQARTCAGCHVGAAADPARNIPVRDLNHDLMAAGHPRLNFELSVFRINEPPHWKTDKYEDQADYEVRVWAMGQAVSARASLELLAARATAAAKDAAPWPEFAETDCFACHSDLRNNSWRRNAGYYKNRVPGNLPYSRWYSAMLPSLEPVATQAAPLRETYGKLENAMSRPYPRPEQIAELARAGIRQADQLIAALASEKIPAEKIQAMANKMKSRQSEVANMRWEEVEQMALAAAVLQPDDTMRKNLADLFQALSFPIGYESPDTYRRTDGMEKALEALLGKP